MKYKNLIGKKVRIIKDSHCGHPVGTIGTLTNANNEDAIITAPFHRTELEQIHNINDFILYKHHVDKNYLKYCLQSGKFKLKGL